MAKREHERMVKLEFSIEHPNTDRRGEQKRDHHALSAFCWPKRFA